MIAGTGSRCLVLVVVASALLGGCTAAGRESPGRCSGEIWQETRLFLGRNIPGGGTVSDAQWQLFVEDTAARRFPDGFTLLDATGFWYDDERAITEQEQSKVLLIVHPQEAAAERSLRAIAREYRERFNQQATLRLDRAVCVTFDSGGGPGQT